MEPIARVIARDRLTKLLSAYLIQKQRSRLGELSVLDVGCGNGYILREMVDCGAAVDRCVGIDKDSALITEARIKSPSAMTYHCDDIFDFPQNDTKFDIIITSGFFAYFDNDGVQKLSRKLRGLLADDGVLITSNYNEHWQKNDNGTVRGLELELDDIRAFNFANKELDDLLAEEFIPFAQYPHVLGGIAYSQYSQLLSHPSQYSGYERLLDNGSVEPTSYLNLYIPR